MIRGIGIDIVEIDRIRTVIEKRGEKFLKRVFSDFEIEYCASKKYPYPSYAARFAAKEAYIKFAGMQGGLKFNRIEVVNGENGKPVMRINGYFDDSLHVSLSHSRKNAVAVVAGGHL